jgi:hypothetical protein
MSVKTFSSASAVDTPVEKKKVQNEEGKGKWDLKSKSFDDNSRLGAFFYHRRLLRHNCAGAGAKHDDDDGVQRDLGDEE